MIPHENAAIDTGEFPLGLYLSHHVIDELAVVTLCLGQCATIVRVCLDVDPYTRKQLLLISAQAAKQVLYLLLSIDATAWLYV